MTIPPQATSTPNNSVVFQQVSEGTHVINDLEAAPNPSLGDETSDFQNQSEIDNGQSQMDDEVTQVYVATKDDIEGTSLNKNYQTHLFLE